MGITYCCVGRNDEAVKKRAQDRVNKAWEFLQGEATLSDVDKFDKAYNSDDIEGLVALLNSNEPIENLPDKMHPWAADPKTVGTLATTQLAILAAREDWPQAKDRIRDAGAIPILVKALSDQHPDRVHASVVALSFLSMDNPTNCVEIYNTGCMPTLIEGLKSPIAGMRGALSQICRNIYVLNLKHRADFKAAGGIKALVNLLEIPPGQTDDLYNQLEVMYHLEDLILDSGEELEEYVNYVKDAGAAALLKKLTKTKDQAVVEAAQYLLVHISD